MTVVLLVEQAGDPQRGSARFRKQVEGLRARSPLQLETVRAGQAGRGLLQLADRLDECAARGCAVAIASPALVAPDELLLRLLDDPSLDVAALVTSAFASSALAPSAPNGHALATLGGRVLAAATEMHPVRDADAGFLGLMYVGTGAGSAVAAALRSAADGPSAQWDSVDLLDLVLMIVVRSGVRPVAAVRAEPLPGARVADEAAEADALAGVGAVDSGDLARRSAARPDDGVYSMFVLRRLSARLTPWFVRAGVPANAVTAVSALVGLCGAGAFALGAWPALLIGALLLQVSLILDCVDGEVARATRTRSAFGGWLDGATDRIKEYAALAGLAVGMHAGWAVWTIAVAAMVVQTARHLQDYAFDKGVLAQWRVGLRDSRPPTETEPWRRPHDRASEAGGDPSATMWLRKLIRMPIGERWLVIGVFAALDLPGAALVAYLALAVVAQAWTLLGAVRRTLASSGTVGSGLQGTLADYRDDGLLAPVLGRRTPQGVAAWLLPPGLTVLEGAALLVSTAAWEPGWVPAAFGWFAVVAWHRYDIAYRAGAQRPGVPRTLALLGGGWAARAAVPLAAAAAGVLPGTLVVGIGWLFLVYVPESLVRGVGTLATNRREHE